MKQTTSLASVMPAKAGIHGCTAQTDSSAIFFANREDDQAWMLASPRWHDGSGGLRLDTRYSAHIDILINPQKQMNIYPLLLLPLMALSACNPTPRIACIATQDIQAYDAVNGAPLFMIHKGDACQTGGFSYGKVDRYTEVWCGQQTGWVIEDRYLSPKK